MRGRPTEADVARYRRIDRILDAALELPPEGRAGYLDQACAGEAELRAAVESMLRAAETPGDGFLEPAGLADLVSDLHEGAAGELPDPAGYHILGPLGSGGMGDVLLAEDLRLGRRVALKVLPRPWRGDEAGMRRLEREGRAVSRLNHPNILTLHEVVDCGGSPCLVLELVEGETLEERLARGRLPPEEAVAVARQVASALAAAHAAGVIHRDLKPRNVMVRRDGVVKVLDFGLAKLVATGDAPSPVPPETEISAPGLVLGTRNYMSPEQATGGAVDPRSDLYSLGVLLNEAAGQRPAALARIIERLMRPDPAERYADAAALLRDLEALRLDLELEAWRRSAAQRAAARPRWRRPWALTAVAALLVVGVAWFLRESLLPTGPGFDGKEPILLGEFANATGQPVFDGTLARALAVHLEQSPHLGLFPEEGVRKTLGYMRLAPDQPLSREIARQVCQRNGIGAMVEGRVARLGRRYVVSLEATLASSGRVFARTMAEAEGEEDVLAALRRAAAELRVQLGESLRSVEEHDAPLEEVTTPSLEALREYALARAQMNVGRNGAAIPLLHEAVRRDPSFASAHAYLATAYRRQGNNALDREHTARAYALRERVSEREALLIAQQYENYVLGDLERAVETLSRWRLAYPADQAPAGLLASIFLILGRHEEAIEQGRAALELNPDDAAVYTDLGLALAILGRLGAARAVLAGAEARGIEMQRLRYGLDPDAWLDADEAARLRRVEGAMGSAAEGVALNRAAAAASERGQVGRAYELGRRAMAAARRVDPGLAGRYGFESALRAAAHGECGQVGRLSRETLELTDHPWALSGVALSQALCGREEEARALLARLSAGHPRDTLIQRAGVPATQAVLAAGAGRPGEALELLDTIRPYEAGTYAALWPAYLRGLVLLRAGRGAEAARELERVAASARLRVGHTFSPPVSVVRFHLATALAASGERARAERLYDDLLAGWRDAGSDLALLAEARAARERLRASP